MSNIIDFLERFGGDAQLRYASNEELEAALRLAGIDPGVRAAILASDQRALEQLLGADSNVCCVINKPDDEEEEEEEEDEDDEHEHEREKDMMVRERVSRRVA